MRIGELSRRTGVSVRLLRYYEEKGLLRPQRRPSGYREYDDEDVATVRGVRTLLAAGLGTATIAELLPCMVEGSDGLAPGCPGLIGELTAERDRISDTIAALEAARDALDRVIEAPAPPGADGDLGCDEPATDGSRPARDEERSGAVPR